MIMQIDNAKTADIQSVNYKILFLMELLKFKARLFVISGYLKQTGRKSIPVTNEHIYNYPDTLLQ